MKTIQLKKGLIMLVDDEDFEIVMQYPWYLKKSSNTYYAHTSKCVKGVRSGFYAHQLIKGTIGTGQEIDHINRNGLDNQKDNLRITSHSDNIKNVRKHRGASKYTGVSKHLYGKWLSRININGKQKHLGLFKTEEAAALAYNNAAIATGNPCYNLNQL